MMTQELFSPYKALMKRAKAPADKALALVLERKYEELQRLRREFRELIAKNRERREGKKPRLSKSQKGFLVNANRDAVEASAEVERQFNEIPGVRAMIKMAMMMEKDDLRFTKAVYETFHPDNKPMAERIQALQGSMIEDMENFLGKPE
jgi:hypothetical protein